MTRPIQLHRANPKAVAARAQVPSCDPAGLPRSFPPTPDRPGQALPPSA